MDPPQRLNGHQDVFHGDLPDLPSRVPKVASAPEYLEVFPDDESNPQGNANPSTRNRIQPSRPPPPPPPKGRLLSACLPDTQQRLGPPPVPPRSRMPLGKKQFSLELPEPAHRLSRSQTQVEHHVSITKSPSNGRIKLHLLPRSHLHN